MYSMRQPVGVGAGITPFNFPAMIPLWMLSPAIAAGNAFILKPSERAPSAPLRLAELMLEAGLPTGVLNVVNGGKTAGDAILGDPDIAAVSFVGSTPIARHVYAQGAAAGKRVQAFGGAKNHMIIMLDADMTKAADALMGAGYGSAGERCRPVLSVVRASSYEEALSLPMEHVYGNGAVIFTRDGDAARDFAGRVNMGMVGINVPVPTPLAYHSFGGWKSSSFGDLNQHGTDSIKFWSRAKIVTARWPSGIRDGAEFQMPTFAGS